MAGKRSGAVVVLELVDPDDLERALQVLRVVHLPPVRVHAAVQDSAHRVLEVFADSVPGSDTRRDVAAADDR